MPTVVVTGSSGLIGAEASRFFSNQGFRVVGVDNDMRKEYFGPEASTAWSRRELEGSLKDYVHADLDIRDADRIEALFSNHGSDVRAVIHTAAQPSHDWAASAPVVDFTVNANGTLALLEATRKFCPKACFVFTSTNKVYGDNPNLLPLVEEDTRWELDRSHPYYEFGIDEHMSIDQTKHSLFGCSKLAADVLVQEYGRYFGMNTVVFRGGCLTGPGHSGAKLHGFLSYLVKCVVTGTPYTILGYKGKQVRDNIHAFDLVNMFWHYVRNPRPGQVYNAGGGRHANCSILEAISITEGIVGRKINLVYSNENRIGDHIWYVSDTRKFQRDYPDWSQRYDLRQTIEEICGALLNRHDTPTV
jgi:CDP-paratose 2-epimerase